MNKNVTSVGFYNDGRFMYSGGEDCMARIWDLRSADCHVTVTGVMWMHSHPLLPRVHTQQCQRLFQANAPVNCMCLHPNQATLVVGDQSGTVHVWDLTTDYNEQLVQALPYSFSV